MKKENGKLIPENAHEARELVMNMRQIANQKLNWMERSNDEGTKQNLYVAAKDLLDTAENLADKWGIGTPA